MTDGIGPPRIRLVLVADDDAAQLMQAFGSSDVYQIAGVALDWNNVEELVRTYAPHIVLVSPQIRPPTHAPFPFLVLSQPIDLPNLPARIQQRLDEFRSGVATTSVATTHQRILGGGNKGGVGKTTVLIEMATRYHQMGIKTLFVDISAACNIAVRLKLQDEVSYQPFPLEEVGKHILLHGTGVSILALPHYFRLQAAQIEGLMNALQQTYPTIFIDGDHLRLYPYIPQVDRTLIVGSANSLQDNLALLHEPSLKLQNAILVLNQLSPDELTGLEEVIDVEGWRLFGLPFQEELPINMELGMTFTSRRASVATPWFRYLDRLAQYLVTGVRLGITEPTTEAPQEEGAGIAASQFVPPDAPEPPPAFTFQPAAPVTQAPAGEPLPSFTFQPAVTTPEPTGSAGGFSFQATPPPTEPTGAASAPTFNFRGGAQATETAPPAAEAPPAFAFHSATATEQAAPSFNFRATPATEPAAPESTNFNFKPAASPGEATPSFPFRTSAAVPPAQEAKEEVVDAEGEEREPTQVFDLDNAAAAGSLEEVMRDKDMAALVARAEQTAATATEPEPQTFDLDAEFFPAEEEKTPAPEAVVLPATPAKPRIKLELAPLQVVMAQIEPLLVQSATELLPSQVDIVAQDEPQTAVELLDTLIDTASPHPANSRNRSGDYRVTIQNGQAGQDARTSDQQLHQPVAGNGNHGNRPTPLLPERPVLTALDSERPRHFNTFKVKVRSKDTK